eukprot:Nitzschia sp. Nitz4//scaffold1_size375055//80232//80759//NITZ4_000232-RA/size375055-processed-gene-0.117-mRNA-1//-1//CDS//3329540913//5840//frame0
MFRTTARSVATISRTLFNLATVPSAHIPSTQTVASFAVRSLSSKYNPSPLDAFRDSVDRQTRATEKVGRSWSVQELRRKSYEDLHKLWYVLYMERNMLLTERQLSRRRQLIFPQPERLQKVRKSMGAIRQVLGERKRSKLAELKQSSLEEAMDAEMESMEVIDIEEETGKADKTK